MPSRVVEIDHISIRVSDFEKSKAFYAKLFRFLGLKPMDEYAEAAGWSNGRTRFWIGAAEDKSHRHKIEQVGFHHYAFQLRSRADIDALEKFLKDNDVEIVDPADEYYDDYYAVFFLDPDGLKLEGMKYGENAAKRKLSAKRRKSVTRKKKR
jgi:catechol 2,3-dioxygenase-like lactoylglutathione lyase family enzyme